MQDILTILGIVGFFFLIGLFIKVDNAHKDKELSLQNEIDSLNEEKLNLEEEIKYFREENAKLQCNKN